MKKILNKFIGENGKDDFFLSLTREKKPWRFILTVIIYFSLLIVGTFLLMGILSILYNTASSLK